MVEVKLVLMLLMIFESLTATALSLYQLRFGDSDNRNLFYFVILSSLTGSAMAVLRFSGPWQAMLVMDSTHYFGMVMSVLYLIHMITKGYYFRSGVENIPASYTMLIRIIATVALATNILGTIMILLTDSYTWNAGRDGGMLLCVSLFLPCAVYHLARLRRILRRHFGSMLQNSHDGKLVVVSTGGHMPSFAKMPSFSDELSTIGSESRSRALGLTDYDPLLILARLKRVIIGFVVAFVLLFVFGSYAALVGPFTAPRRNFSQRERHDDIFLVDDVMFLYCFCLIVYGWRRVAATGGGNNNNNQSADDEW
eukprot:CAMPEP_0170179244 /NCGR_PEP_ID=MMETSP0040_2-20121228/17044_1 /TAXON_ID=641309 /ORGANISM="Lotharella oceanica, Strain CCMP622" /LENGTH=309 /DNA_ID=CAMNT_0010423197 /DNA_START=31 /DNA_END=957 /DNA_ORIENTATION=-